MTLTQLHRLNSLECLHPTSLRDTSYIIHLGLVFLPSFVISAYAAPKHGQDWNTFSFNFHNQILADYYLSILKVLKDNIKIHIYIFILQTNATLFSTFQQGENAIFIYQLRQIWNVGIQVSWITVRNILAQNQNCTLFHFVFSLRNVETSNICK